MNPKYGCGDAALALTVGEIRNITYDDRQVIELVKTIKILQQYAKFDGEKTFRIPREFLHLYRKMRNGRYCKQMEKNIALRRAQGRTRYPNKDFSKIRKLCDLLRTEEYDDTLTFQDLIDRTAFTPDKKHLFYDYVNDSSKILHNMMKIPIDIHACFIILLFPLLQYFSNKANADVYTQVWGYYGKAPLPEDLNGITRSVPRRVGNGNKEKRELIWYIIVSLIADFPEIHQSIDEGYENISKWETCLKLLKAAFSSYKPGNFNKTIIKSNVPTFYTNTFGYTGNIGTPRSPGFTSWGSPPFGFQTALCPYCHNPIVTRWPSQTKQCYHCASPGLSTEKKAWLDQVISSPDIPNQTPNSNYYSQCDKKLTDNQKSNASIAPTVPSQLSSKRSTCLDTASSVSPKNADLASFELTNQRKNVIVSPQLLSESSSRRYATLEKSLINADLASFDQILDSQFQSGSTKPADQTASSNGVKNSHVHKKRASTEVSASPAKKKSRSLTLDIDVPKIPLPTSKAIQPYSKAVDDTVQSSISNSNVDGSNQKLGIETPN